MTPDQFAELARSRRTSMVVDHDREVPVDVVTELCELATWAPSHKRTWPWQFALFRGDARARLGEQIADSMEQRGDLPEKVSKTRTKYLRTPATLVVASTPGDTELRTAENRDAAAAGVQNILLGATAHGLASYWSSCPKGANDTVVELCGFEPASHIVAIIYLGWAGDSVATPERPPVKVRVVDE